MTGRQEDMIVGAVPESIAAQAAALGLTDSTCLFCARGDLGADGAAREVWLVAGKAFLVALAPDATAGKPVAGPFEYTGTQKVRTFQLVGGAVLQVMIDGFFVSVLRYSNARRETFSRARVQLDRVLKHKEFQPAALRKPSERECARCGTPLSETGGSCLRCSRRHGILLRSIGLMRPYWKSIAILLALMLTGVAVDLVPPQLQRILVDRVIVPRAHVEWMMWILLGIVVISLFRALLQILIGRISAAVGTKVTRDMREQLQAKLMSLNVDYYDRHSVGSLMSRVLNDVDFFQGFVAQVAQGFLCNLMLVLGIGTMLFVMNWRLAILVMLPIPLVVIGTMFFWRHIYPRYYQFWDSSSKMSQLLSGLLSGVRLVKAFGQEDRERKRFAQTADYMRSARRNLETGTATFHPIMGFVFSFGGLLVWYGGGHAVFEGHLTLGMLMAFFGYLGMFYTPISSLSMFSNWVTGFLSSAQRVYEILDSQSSLPIAANVKPLRDVRGGIEFKNVTFGYDPYLPVLKGVSFAIEPGQFVGIVGKSGSGKTTLVNLVCRFYDVQEGQVLLDGQDVRDLQPEDLRRQVGLVLQEPFLFRGSIAENIAYGRPSATAMEILDAAKAANAHDFTSRRPAAYDTRLGERGAGLSGGERQRVSIARALLCEPRILILDEATSSVDTESEQEIQKALAELCKGRTTIAIAHRLSTLKNADRILVMDDGKIAEAGTHKELMAIQNGVYHKLVLIQTELTRLDM